MQIPKSLKENFKRFELLIEEQGEKLAKEYDAAFQKMNERFDIHTRSIDALELGHQKTYGMVDELETQSRGRKLRETVSTFQSRSE